MSQWWEGWKLGDRLASKQEMMEVVRSQLRKSPFLAMPFVTIPPDEMAAIKESL